MPLSCIITTKNAGQTIRETLTSVKFADEILVIDSGSTDQTVNIAKQLGARVIQQQWLGYGPQKNIGLKHTQHDWLLFIDADEQIPSKLSQEILQIVNPEQLPPDKGGPTRGVSNEHSFYWLRITTIFLNRPLNHLYGHNLRLFKRDAGHWNNQLVHEQVIDKSGQPIKLGDKKSGLLTEPLLHHSHPTISSYLKKMHYYTTLDAKQMTKTNTHRSGKPTRPTWHLPYQLATKQFLKLLFYRKGFLDGYPGIVWCILSAYYELEMGKKYLAMKKQTV